MANISDAFGTISIEGDWSKEDVEDLVYVLISQTWGQFSIWSWMLETSKTFNKLVKQFLKGEEVDFSASGRWAFECNLEAFHKWSEMDKISWDSCMKLFSSAKKISFKNYQKRRLRLIKSMQKKSLQLVWDYKDFEPGVGFMLDSCGYITAENNEFIYIRTSIQYYDFTLKDYCLEFQNDLERLDAAAYNIAEYLGLDQSSPDVRKVIAGVIQAHPTWYDLGVYDFDDMESAPRCAR